MANIIENFNLRSYNTFGIDAVCGFFAESNSVDELKSIVKNHRNLKTFILGGGSNILFTSNFEGLVIYPTIKGFEIIAEDNETVTLSVAAGENWDDFVNFAVKNGWGGVENLSLIPGNVGASPIQNIGAYGVEAKDTIFEVKGFYLDTLANFSFTNSECNFGYRDSIFKNELKGKVLITHVWFRLQKQPILVTHYGNLVEEIEKTGDKTIAGVRKAVIGIRESKLPDPKVLGNAGSFFKNPVIEIELFNQIKSRYPQVPSYPVDEYNVKLPAGWLIEICGWKGKQLGNAGVHAKQALVIVNNGGALGREVLTLAKSIKESVFSEFKVDIEMEVNIL
jgi:UDP-N-acetylmuramate dehydrogenase